MTEGFSPIMWVNKGLINNVVCYKKQFALQGSRSDSASGPLQGVLFISSSFP